MSNYTDGKWRHIRDNYYQFYNDEVMSVYGTLDFHIDVPEGHDGWFYSARVTMNARKKGLEPIEGYAPTLENAKAIVETLLHKTLTGG